MIPTCVRIVVLGLSFDAGGSAEVTTRFSHSRSGRRMRRPAADFDHNQLTSTQCD
jgi:hypothetical protein